MPSTIARSTSSTRASTAGVSTSSAHRKPPRVLTNQYAAPTGVSRVPNDARAACAYTGSCSRRPPAVGSSSGDADRPAGLVVDDQSEPPSVHVDAVGGAAEAQRAPVGEREVDRGRAVGEAEAQLGGDGAQARLGPHVVVLGEEAVELGEDPAPVAVPEQPAAGAALRLVAPPCAPRRSRAAGRGRRRSRRVGRGRALGPGEDLGEERVERLVHEAAAVERRDLVALLGQLRDLDPQHVLEEVVVTGCTA